MADEMRKIMIERFEKQDPKDGFYDVTFKISDKVLHAHRFLLSTVSPTFQAMFSENWDPSSEPIEIKTCPFEIFKKFIAYFYHGVCDFDERDVFDIIDLAEMYQVQTLKNQFDEFLSEMRFTDENVYRLLEVSEFYGYQQAKESLGNYLVGNWETLFQRDDFLAVKQEVLLCIMGLDKDGNEKIENALFEKIFAWSERKAKEKNSNFDSLKLEEQQALIKAEMAPFLPKFKFGFRSVSFLNNFVAPRSYVFDNWKRTLNKARKTKDDIDKDDREFYQKFQILPNSFNGRYHEVLRGITFCKTKKPLEELIKVIKKCKKENGAYRITYNAKFRLKIYKELECNYNQSQYFFGCTSTCSPGELVLGNTVMFRHNQNLMDLYHIICYLEGDNFPEIDDEEEENEFCIQLL